jgi:hypothetical protein
MDETLLKSSKFGGEFVSKVDESGVSRSSWIKIRDEYDKNGMKNIESLADSMKLETDSIYELIAAYEDFKG